MDVTSGYQVLLCILLRVSMYRKYYLHIIYGKQARNLVRTKVCRDRLNNTLPCLAYSKAIPSVRLARLKSSFPSKIHSWMSLLS